MCRKIENPATGSVTGTPATGTSPSGNQPAAAPVENRARVRCIQPKQPEANGITPPAQPRAQNDQAAAVQSNLVRILHGLM